MISFEATKKILLSDPGVRAAYAEMKPEFEIAARLIEARVKANLTQEEVAVKMGTTQSVVARLESGRHFPSFRSLQKYARAVDQKIPLEIRP